MKRCILSFLVLSLTLFAHCGKKDLILTVDLLSYVEPEFRSVFYGPVLPGLPDVPIALMAAQVNLLQGIDDATEVKATALRIGADFDNETGSADGRLEVFVAPIDLWPLDVSQLASFTPVVDVDVSLRPNHTTTVSEEIPSTPELLEVLTSDLACWAVRVTCSTQGSTNVLWGKVTLTEVTAILVTVADL